MEVPDCKRMFCNTLIYEIDSTAVEFTVVHKISPETEVLLSVGLSNRKFYHFLRIPSTYFNHEDTALLCARGFFSQHLLFLPSLPHL